MAKRGRILMCWASALAFLIHAEEVHSAFHLVVIEEVFFGTPECPDAQYVELRMVAPFQVLVAGQRTETQMADGSEAPDFGRFNRNLTNGQAGAHMILGTQQAAALFGMTFDEVVTGRLVQPDGRVCFGFVRSPAGPVDCVAYGAFTGDNDGFGSPAVAPVLGMALVRRSETDDNAADFILGEPMPENNAGEVGTLGECPAAEPTPTATVGIDACTGDCNSDFEVTVDEVVRGVSIALGASPVDGCLPFDADASNSVTVDEVVTAVSNALNGCGG
jgi:hypothetical protein